MKSKDRNTFLDALEELEKEKGIDKNELIEKLKAGLLVAYKKDFDEEENLEVEIDMQTGDVKMFVNKLIVDDSVLDYNKNFEISLLKAKTIKKRAKVGETLKLELNTDNFKRNAIQRTKSMIIQFVREKEKETLINSMKQIEFKLVNMLVRKIEANGNIFVRINDIDAYILKRELSILDEYKVGDTLSAYVRKVDLTSKYPKVELTRLDDMFIQKLLEREIPEISNKNIEIKSIAREPGVKTKIAIFSNDPNIDLKGSCIGKDGVRINAIINELNGEKIELVEYDHDLRLFVRNALYPAEVFSAEVIKNNEELIAKVEVDESQLNLAIGKRGINVKLAGKLCSLKVNVTSYTSSEEENKEEGTESAE